MAKPKAFSFPFLKSYSVASEVIFLFCSDRNFLLSFHAIKEFPIVREGVLLVKGNFRLFVKQIFYKESRVERWP